MRFVKMQACGNDYIYFNLLDGRGVETDFRALSGRLSNRHFGIGADGIVLILPSKRANCLMRMFNADGSEGVMCGNAIRCVGKYLFEQGYINGDICTVDTLSGVKVLELERYRGRVERVRVDMGVASFNPSDIPMSGGELNGGSIEVNGVTYTASALSMGNPHLVVFTDCPEELPLESVGVLFENHKRFPSRTNTEFVCVRGGELFVRVFERGSGETLACGTGACAAAVASHRLGLVPSSVVVHLMGGDLAVECGNRVYLSGGCEFVFSGEIELEQLE